MSSTPASGRKVMTESSGKPIWSPQLMSAPPHPGEDDDEHEHAAEDVHRVVLHAPGLDGPQVVAEPVPEPGHAVDGAVDDARVDEGPEPAREAERGAHGHDRVEVVHVPVSYTHL